MMSNARPFSASTSKLAYAQAFTGPSVRRNSGGFTTLLRRLAQRRSRSI